MTMILGFCLSYDKFNQDFRILKKTTTSKENVMLSLMSLWCYIYVESYAYE